MLKRLFFLVFLSSCIQIPNPHEELPSGIWRGIIKLDPTPYFANPKAKPLPELEELKMEEVTQGQLPFYFETVESDGFYFKIQDHAISSRISIGRDKATAKDTISIAFENSNALIEAIFEENVMEGTYTNTEGLKFPFVAWYGKNYLFSTLKKSHKKLVNSKYDIKVQWEDRDSLEILDLTIIQDGNELTGIIESFNLKGTIQGDKIYLSGFNGIEGILIEGKVDHNEKFIGTIRDLSNRKGIWIF